MLKIIYKNIEELIPYINNSRTHSDAQVAQIAASIKEFGFNNAVSLDGQNGIIAGHGRVLAARLLNLKEVPTVDLSHLSDIQKKAYIIADNKLALNAGWDEAILHLEIAELKEADFNVDLLGFSEDELNLLEPVQMEGLTDDDAVPDVPEEPITKLGDIYQLGNHRLMCGDSTSIDAVEKLMDGKLADVCWTDPPYNVAYEGSAGKIKNDDMSDGKFRQFLIDAFISMWKALKPGASIYVAHADTEGFNFRHAFKNADFKLSGCLIWKKNSLVLGRSDYQWIHEPILYGWKKGASHKWYGGRKQTTLTDFKEQLFEQIEDGKYKITVGDKLLIINGNVIVEELNTSIITEPKPKRSSEHPTMKPVALIERMIESSSRSGEMVLDLFGGSGSTLITCQKINRKAYLMELDPKYCDVIVKRWEEFTGKKACRLSPK